MPSDGDLDKQISPSANDDEARRISVAAAKIASTLSRAEADYNAAKDEGKSRSRITNIVVGTWAASIAAYAAACFITLFRVPVTDATAAQAAVANISELIKVGVLPLTAIVVGYYLSRS